ncbi:MAG: hypothetical protein OXH90_01720 [Paracoccaceae bacterium]|nr:hypothetical protein [Paracoccaceae bacterium]MDE2916077.1 hypothetical protein [Paracoccaceae bacterium]
MNEEKYGKISLDCLLLDPENPRLPREQNWHDVQEEEILKEFYKRYNLIELAYSIADKGFTPRHAEALLVIEVANSQNQYIVVEGNRRLATLKLLTNETYRKNIRVSSEWDELSEKAAHKRLDPVPVVIYQSREILNDYLGFRHITGPTPWRPEAKARFIARLLKSGETINAVARRIGSNPRTVRRFAESHAIYTQALNNGISMDQAEAAFGIFYNAIDQFGIRNFLGLGKQSEIKNLPNDPIPEGNIDNLKKLIGLLYGDGQESLNKVIKESRELKMLGEVLDDERGRRNLFHERDLERAWHMMGGGRQELVALLESAYIKLAQANGQAKQYKEDKEVCKEVKEIVSLVAEMSERFDLKEG